LKWDEGLLPLLESLGELLSLEETSEWDSISSPSPRAELGGMKDEELRISFLLCLIDSLSCLLSLSY